MENRNSFTCPICGNTDIHAIGYLNGKPYCRRCISFRGEEVEHKTSYPKKASIHLQYELSLEQKELSDKLVENYKKGIDSLVFAVCGSGKTEIVMKVISFIIEKGKKVGFAVPRKDVVIELKERFKNVFKNNVVTAVYGGHTSKVEGDLICLTTHQLFRYENYFDLLILDETDAFPFNRNAVLEAICKRSIKGNLILMSATSKEQDVRKLFKHNYMKLELYTRFHGHPLPVPQIMKRNSALMLIELIKEIKRFIRNGKQTFIFVPTIKICEKTYSFLKIFIKEGECVHSQKRNRNEIIQRFRGGKTKYLVTTAVLERGVTIKDVQVIVFHAENNIYDESALVQISGRVGRKIDAPDGEVLFMATQITKGMTESIKIIKNANEKLFEDRRNRYDKN